MKGESKPGYRRPRTGEKRSTRQPLEIDKLSEEARETIQKLRAEGKTWQEISERSEKFAGKPLAVSTLHRWYDLRVEQVQREVLAQSERARQLAAVFAKKGFDELPEATVNALSSEVFGVMEDGTPREREKALGNLLFLLTKLMAAQSRQKLVELENAKLELQKKKFETLGAKVHGLKDQVEKRKLTSEELARKLDEIYDIAQQ